MKLISATSPAYSDTLFSDMGREVVGANKDTFFYICVMKVKFMTLLIVFTVISVAPSIAALGQHGESLALSQAKGIKAGQSITVRGKNFDKTVGIYVELCEVVPAGILPTSCGGGVNMSGTGAASYWISSNPPAYGRNLAIPFKSGGAFSVALKVQPIIGKIDCRIVACAVYVRADHTRTQDRTHDIKVPITFSK